MRVVFLLLVLAALAYGVARAGRWGWGWWQARRTARSKWTVETRAKRHGVIGRSAPPSHEWAVVLRRPGEEQVFRYVAVGEDDALLEAQAAAEAHAHILNEGRRK